MLHLPQVTLFAIDCLAPHRTLQVMRRSKSLVAFGRSVLLTDFTRNAHLIPEIKAADIEPIHLVENDEKVIPYPGGPSISVAYNLDILRLAASYCETSHQLMIEWDACVLNPEAWEPHWLKYDFIGAPWVPHNNPGWPVCDETNNVGNFGLSLRSRAFCDECASMYAKYKDDHVMRGKMVLIDSFMCRTMRPDLERRRIRFAPERDAARFSCENRIYSGQFGFHGKYTAGMNNWGEWLKDIR